VARVTASAGLVTAVRSAKQFLTYVSAGPFQYAVAEALRLPDSCFDGLRADLRAKRDLLSAGPAEAGFEVYRPAGTYFVTTDIRPLGGETHGFAFCRALPERCGVVPIPDAVFHEATRRRSAARSGSPPASGRTCRTRPSRGSRGSEQQALRRRPPEVGRAGPPLDRLSRPPASAGCVPGRVREAGTPTAPAPAPAPASAPTKPGRGQRSR
jgi:Aminotransferase class I and II